MSQPLLCKISEYICLRTRVLIQCHQQRQSCLIHWGNWGKFKNDLKTHSTILVISIFTRVLNIKYRPFKWVFFQYGEKQQITILLSFLKIIFMATFLVLHENYDHYSEFLSWFCFPCLPSLGRHTRIINHTLPWMALLYFQILNSSSNKDLPSQRILKSMSLNIGKQFNTKKHGVKVLNKNNTA